MPTEHVPTRTRLPPRDRVRGPWATLGASWLMWIFVGAFAITPASILPTVMTDLAIGEATAAWIISAPQVAATVVGLPIGMGLDRIDNRRAMAASVAILLVAGLGSTLAGRAGSYPGLVAARLLAGGPLVALWTANTNVVSNAFDGGVRATAVSAFVTGYPAGYAFGQLAGPLVANRFHWATSFLLFSATGFGLFACFWWASASLDRDHVDASPPRLTDFAAVFRNRGVWGVCLLSLALYTLYMIFNSWLPSYLSTSFGLSLTESGLFVAVFPAIGIVSRPLGGALSDRVFERRRRPVLLLGFAVTAVVVVGMAFSTTVPVLVAGMFAAGFFLQLPVGLLYTYVQDFVDDGLAGTAIGAVSVVGWLGSFVGPVVVGALIESTGAYLVVFAFALGLAVFGVGVVAVIAESGPAATREPVTS